MSDSSRRLNSCEELFNKTFDEFRGYGDRIAVARREMSEFFGSQRGQAWEDTAGECNMWIFFYSMMTESMRKICNKCLSYVARARSAMVETSHGKSGVDGRGRGIR